MANAHTADALVCISNCDKITPGMLMAALRLNIPAVFVYGGTIKPGCHEGRDLNIVSVFEALGVAQARLRALATP